MSFIRYRQATAHMNERYPDATVEELEATGDRTCIICREQMVHGGEPGRERTRPKKLRCGHILHFHCLRSWLERQQNCPTWYTFYRYTGLILQSTTCPRGGPSTPASGEPPPSSWPTSHACPTRRSPDPNHAGSTTNSNTTGHRSQNSSWRANKFTPWIHPSTRLGRNPGAQCSNYSSRNANCRWNGVPNHTNRCDAGVARWQWCASAWSTTTTRIGNFSDCCCR